MLFRKSDLHKVGVGFMAMAAVAGIQSKLVSCFIIGNAFCTPGNINKLFEEWNRGKSPLLEVGKVRRQKWTGN